MLRPAHILVVDDEPANRILLQIALQRVGYTVQIAGAGHAALELYDAHPGDLVLLDAMLPDMDGFAVCVELRKRSQGPIVMLTALSRYQDIIQGFGVGVDEYISKPYLMGELIVRLRAVLRRGPSSNASI